MDDDDVQDNKVFFCSEDVFDDAQRLGRHRRGDSRARQLRFGIPEFHVGEYDDDDDEAGKRTTTIEEGGAAHRVLASRAGIETRWLFFLYLIAPIPRPVSRLDDDDDDLRFVQTTTTTRSSFRKREKNTTSLFFFFFFFFWT